MHTLNTQLWVWHCPLVFFILYFFFLAFSLVCAWSFLSCWVRWKGKSKYISESDKKSDLRHVQLCLSLAHSRNARRVWRLFIRWNSCRPMEWFTINRASSALTAMGHLRWPLLLSVVCSFVTSSQFSVEDLVFFFQAVSYSYLKMFHLINRT